MRTAAQKERNATRQRRVYREGGAVTREASRTKVARVRAGRIPLINQIKLELGCIDCGYDEHPAALHFDHRDPATKRFAIAKGLTRAWLVLLAEIDKCDVRCANCHAIRGVRENHLGRPRLNGIGIIGEQLMAEGLATPYESGRR